MHICFLKFCHNSVLELKQCLVGLWQTCTNVHIPTVITCHKSVFSVYMQEAVPWYFCLQAFVVFFTVSKLKKLCKQCWTVIYEWIPPKDIQLPDHIMTTDLNEWGNQTFFLLQFKLVLNKQIKLERKCSISSNLEKAKEEATIRIFSVLSPSYFPPNEHSLHMCKDIQVPYLTHCPTAAYLYHRICCSLQYFLVVGDMICGKLNSPATG